MSSRYGKIKETRTEGLFFLVDRNEYWINLKRNNIRLRKLLKTSKYSEAKNLFYSEFEKALTIVKRKEIKKLQPIKLKSAIDQYLEYCEVVLQLEYSTVKSKWIKLTQLLEFLGNKFLKDINASDYESFIVYRSRSNISKFTINGDIRNHRAFFNYCKKKPSKNKPYISTSPLEDIKIFNVERRTRKANPKEDIIKFLNFIKTRNERFYIFLKLTFSTLARRGEIFRLSFDDIDLTKKTLTFKNTKGKKPRILPLSNLALDVLKSCERFNESRLVFPDMWADKTSYYLRTYRSQVRLKTHITIHSLRHSGASMLYELGEPIGVISELLGHSDIHTTMIYLDVQDERKKTALEKVTL